MVTQQAASALQGSEVLVEQGIQTVRLFGDVLASIRGVTFARVTNRVSGSLKVDFDLPVGPLGAVAQPLLLEARLDEAGAAIEDFRDWTPGTSERSFRISGELSPSGLRRIFSIFELDGSVVDRPESGEAPKAADDQPERYGVSVETTLHTSTASRNTAIRGRHVVGARRKCSMESVPASFRQHPVSLRLVVGGLRSFRRLRLVDDGPMEETQRY